MNRDQHYNQGICPSCHTAMLEDHPSIRFWLKCPICAYSEPDDPEEEGPEGAVLEFHPDVH